MRKNDLQRFATKADVRRCIVEIKRHFDIIAKGLERSIDKIADDVARMAATPNP